jgi:hypothetical protein
MRSKWDRQQSGSTYGMLTMEKVMSSVLEVYKPAGKQSTAKEDFLLRSLTLGDLKPEIMTATLGQTMEPAGSLPIITDRKPDMFQREKSGTAMKMESGSRISATSRSWSYVRLRPINYLPMH